MIKQISEHWIHIEMPTVEELESMTKKFNLEIDLLKDALDPFEVSRLEKEEGKTYFFMRTPLPNKEMMLTSPVLLIIDKRVLITIAQIHLPIFEKIINIGESKKPLALLILLLTEINNTYNNSLISINREIWQASTNIEKINNKEIAQFVEYERITNDYLSRLIQNGLVLSQFNGGKYLKLNEEESELAEDLLLGNNQLIDISKNSLQSVKNIRDAYSTILSNDLNRVIKLLTSLTIILNVPTMIAGLWGMNVGVPFAKSIYAFLMVLALIIVICLFLIKLFRKRDWL